MHEAELLERERELEALDGLIDATAAGDGRLLIVDGPAGIGKSTLLGGLRGGAERRLRVLSARGSELEREFPFGVVRQLFETAVADPDQRERVLAGAATPASAVFAAPGENGEAAGASFATLHGLYWLALNLATEKPLLLSIDDLHWCDAPSMRFAAYLARRLEGSQILLAVALRTGEPVADAALLGELTQDPAAERLRPGPLSRAGVGELVRERLGREAAEAFNTACHDATGGNPLLLGQLLAGLEADSIPPDAAHADAVREVGPRAVSSTVLLRLSRLPAEAAGVAQAVAVLGDAADLPAVAALAGTGEAEVAEATRALARAQLLRPEPPLGYVHPLVRDAVYYDLSPAERELRHQQAARLLADAEAPAEQLASHVLETAPRGDEWAAKVLHRAGRAAMGRGAPDVAATLLRRALDEPPPPDRRGSILFELGGAEVLTSGPDAVEHLRAAYDAVEDPVVRAITAGLLGRVLMFTGAPAEAGEVARRAAAEVPPDLEDLRRALEAFALIVAYFGADEPVDFDRLESYRDGVDGDGPGARMLEAASALEWTYSAGPLERCVALALRSLRDNQLLFADAGLMFVATLIVLTLADREEAIEAAEAALAEAHRHGSLFTAAGIHMWHGFTLYRRGELGPAETQIRTAMEEFQLWGFAEQAEVYASGFLAGVLLERGDLAGARAALEGAEDPGDSSDGARFWLNTRMELLVAEGRAEEAIEAADEFARRFGHYANPAQARWRSSKAQALARLDRRDEAIALMDDELAAARRWGAPSAVGTTLRLLGVIKGEAGEAELREAVEVLEGSTAKLELAKALLSLGSHVRRTQRPSDAREPLRRALELAASCDAPGVAETARAELHAAGARPRRDALQGPESLTPSERRVADLAAGGQTNRDIAQTLYVTPKTVEVHLSNAYRKLGIRSRRELEGALTP
jgi:DNA-binding CsgD family transcriptional regulator